MSTYHGIALQRNELHVRNIGNSEGLLKGADQIAGYLFGDRALAAQVERLITDGEFPYFRLNGLAHSTKSSLHRFANRVFGSHSLVEVYTWSQSRAAHSDSQEGLPRPGRNRTQQQQQHLGHGGASV